MEKLKQFFTFGLLLRLVLVGVFIVIFNHFYSKQESEKTEKLKECSFFTVITPIKMPDRRKMYYFYNYHSERHENNTSVNEDDLGAGYTSENALKKRYWIQVHCNDFQTDRVRWDVPVPDTLQYIPVNGWDKIPYGLDAGK